MVKLFKIGDKVVLKSGGPEMTVIGHSRNGRIWCEWERPGDPGFPHEGSFVPVTLSRLAGANSPSLSAAPSNH